MNSSNNQAIHLLKQHGFRKTASRMAVLRAFLRTTHALSHQYIDSIVGNDFDRVTIYRTLLSFIESGIIHKIPDPAGPPKYALCIEGHCHDGIHQDHHVHFACNQCKQTFCIEDVSVPGIQLPRSYAISKVNFLIEGTCKNCFEPVEP